MDPLLAENVNLGLTTGSDATQRFFISQEFSDFKYVLPSDEEERERLAFQSQTIIKLFDDKTILTPVVLNDGDSILDSGTGSGHWVLSCSKDVPATINLHGIDISSRIFPKAPSLPPNATFLTASITSLPNDWTNKFSLINQRLMCAGLNAEQWDAALSEIHRVLVPGGWIQLIEPHWILQSPSEAIQKHKAFKMKNDLCFKRQIVIDAVSVLERWLINAGFVNVKVVEKRGLPLGSWGGEIGIGGMNIISQFLRSLKEPIIREGGFGMVETGEECEAAVDELAELCETTPATFYEYWLIVAQKPQL
ncbi:hypothetical protein AGABI2DRAFT_188421 [Agaricus bisporus var. bisporus H97]|uniref:hypothetical protein n=1 Tax=Agaricus bisporus var. bisporus (strain H97 / ATCC MYA-4626 / FGSC 10389) TaxID=936046 RepID=UPI00029F7774|nr:hypothetical protein AGABI2DRAFT_188421 [Agaricus bisporus var. bisporus H97]EKV42811.1 hypothetical protein AGABI2DRAFT_188421 [Agaricus bisporus var. bisporus H97]